MLVCGDPHQLSCTCTSRRAKASPSPSPSPNPNPNPNPDPNPNPNPDPNPNPSQVQEGCPPALFVFSSMATCVLLCGCLSSILIYPVIYHIHRTLTLTPPRTLPPPHP